MTFNLSQLKIGEVGVITGYNIDQNDSSHALNQDIMRRLMEMGAVIGAPVKIMYEAPFGKDPLAIEVRGVLIAIRRNEANCILISRGSNEQ